MPDQLCVHCGERFEQHRHGDYACPEWDTMWPSLTWWHPTLRFEAAS